jgi:hypothetical protein
VSSLARPTSRPDRHDRPLGLRKLAHHDLRMSRESALTTRSLAAGSGRSGPAITAKVLSVMVAFAAPRCRRAPPPKCLCHLVCGVVELCGDLESSAEGFDVGA